MRHREARKERDAHTLLRQMDQRLGVAGFHHGMQLLVALRKQVLELVPIALAALGQHERQPGQLIDAHGPDLLRHLQGRREHDGLLAQYGALEPRDTELAVHGEQHVERVVEHPFREPLQTSRRHDELHTRMPLMKSGE